MTITPFSLPFLRFPIIILLTLISSPALTAVNGLGSASTTAITYATGTVCGIVAGDPTKSIKCYQKGQTILVQPNISFQAISGGRTFFCGLRSGGFSVHCWDTTPSDSSFHHKRIYSSNSIQLTDLTVGDSQVCALEVNSGIARCWRGGDRYKFPSPGNGFRFSSISSGSGFSCGVLKNSKRVLCWGGNVIGEEIQTQFGNLSMSSLVAGESHVCGLTTDGVLVCNGNNNSGQVDVPFKSASEVSGLALGGNFTCAIRRRNGLVACWGGSSKSVNGNGLILLEVSFESIIAGLDFVCGLATRNLSIICWGPGWSNELSLPSVLPLGMIIPGPCVEASCGSSCMYPNSESLCHGTGIICRSCQIELPLASPLPPMKQPESPYSQPNSQSTSKIGRRELLASLIVGSVGGFAGFCAMVYCVCGRRCDFLMRAGSTVSPSPSMHEADGNMDTMPNSGSNGMPARSLSSKRQSSRTLRQSHRRSGSSSKYVDKTENFSLAELALATNNFSTENRIGSGSFGTVYKGKLADSREVAIKRGETCIKRKKFQEKENAFDSELVLLSRLHHKHLVGLIGFCEENDERLLVYEYMCNGSLYDHLHNKNNTEKSSSILNSWKMRIKVALDAARGIEYLHNYAVPPIIHRDIKSSNILLDSNWTARVSDFGLSMMRPENEQENMSAKAVGTVGYIDPEYYVLNILTTKSDVFGFGVVLLELLTGRRAVFNNENDNSGPMRVVDYAGPKILAGYLHEVLDYRVGNTDVNETDAVVLMAYTAMHCVSLEGKERPSMVDIVVNLERALEICQETDQCSPASFSPTTLSTPFATNT